EADDGELREAVGDVDLDGDLVRVDAGDGGGADDGEHGAKMGRGRGVAVIIPTHGQSNERGFSGRRGRLSYASLSCPGPRVSDSRTEPPMPHPCPAPRRA